ncbi:MAG: NAD(P)-dependent oxidoreductase [Armatimonadetes bacterium]|nr:NAD(P)-dependent oxidoreductase [Armatimonadota bacterium]
MRVLVTGAAGRVGRMVCPYLAQRHTLRLFDLVPAEAPEGEMWIGSILDRPALAEAMAGMEGVLHLAYGARRGADAATFDELSFDVNTKGTFFVAQAAAAAGVRRLVYTSSLSLYEGNMPAPGCQFTEEAPIAPVTSYALTKYLGEEVLRTASRTSGLEVVCLRLTYPTWPEEWPKAASRWPGTIRTAAADVAAACHLALVTPDLRFEVIHIASDTPGCPWDISKARRVLGYAPTFQFT